jgi:hypothetical protein
MCQIQSCEEDKVKSKHLFPIASAVSILVIASLACVGLRASTPEPPTPASAPIQINTPLPPPTERPTSAPEPTVEQPTEEPVPTEESVQVDEEFLAEIQSYQDEGYISSVEGEYIELVDFEEEWAQLGWYSWWPFEDVVLRNFVADVHLKWSSALATNDPSGCGLVFAINGDEHNYAVFLDKSRIMFTDYDGNFWYEHGKSRGSGRVDFGNPAEADFTLIVNEYEANVLVNGDFVGEYTLSEDLPLEGNFGYSLLSGTNKDYGTRCEITNARVWKLE